MRQNNAGDFFPPQGVSPNGAVFSDVESAVAIHPPNGDGATDGGVFVSSGGRFASVSLDLGVVENLVWIIVLDQDGGEDERFDFLGAEFDPYVAVQICAASPFPIVSGAPFEEEVGSGRVVGGELVV